MRGVGWLSFGAAAALLTACADGPGSGAGPSVAKIVQVK